MKNRSEKHKMKMGKKIYARFSNPQAGRESERGYVQLHCKENEFYLVNTILVCAYSTEVYLDIYPNRGFNSVFFDFYAENHETGALEPYNIYSDPDINGFARAADKAKAKAQTREI